MPKTTCRRGEASPPPYSAAPTCRLCSLPLTECEHSQVGRGDTTRISVGVDSVRHVNGDAMALDAKKKRRCRKCPGNPLRSQCEHTKEGRLYLHDQAVSSTLQAAPSIVDPDHSPDMASSAALSANRVTSPAFESQEGLPRSESLDRRPPFDSPDNQPPSFESQDGLPRSESLDSQPQATPLLISGLPSTGPYPPDSTRNNSLPPRLRIILNRPQDRPQPSTSSVFTLRSVSNSSATPSLPQAQQCALEPPQSVRLLETSTNTTPSNFHVAPMDIDSETPNSEGARLGNPTPVQASQHMDIDPAPMVPASIPLNHPTPALSEANGASHEPAAPAENRAASAEPEAGSSSQISKVEKVRKRELKHGYVFGTMRGSKEHKIIRKHKRPTAVEDGKLASKRFLESMNRLLEKADDIAGATSCWIYIAAQHPSAIGPFIHYTSPRLAREAPARVNEIINATSETMAHLVHSRRADALALIDKLRQSKEDLYKAKEEKEAILQEKETILQEKETLQETLMRHEREAQEKDRLLALYRQQLNIPVC